MKFLNLDDHRFDLSRGGGFLKKVNIKFLKIRQDPVKKNQIQIWFHLQKFEQILLSRYRWLRAVFWVRMQGWIRSLNNASRYSTFLTYGTRYGI